MISAGVAAAAPSNHSRSTCAALLEDTLKLTPSGRTVAPSGALVPCRMARIEVCTSCPRCDRCAGLHPPDVATVLADGPIGREPADTGAVHDRHARPVRRVGIG